MAYDVDRPRVVRHWSTAPLDAAVRQTHAVLDRLGSPHRWLVAPSFLPTTPGEYSRQSRGEAAGHDLYECMAYLCREKSNKKEKPRPWILASDPDDSLAFRSKQACYYRGLVRSCDQCDEAVPCGSVVGY